MSQSLALVRLLYVGVPVLSCLVGLVLLYWIRLTQWDRRGATWFAATTAASVAWNLALLGHLLATDWQWQLFFRHVEELAGLTTLSLFVVFVSVYTQRDFHRRPACRAALAIVLGGGTALVLTSPFHSLLYSDVVQMTTPVPYLDTVYGVGYAPSAILVLLLNGYSAIELVRHLFETGRKTGLQLLAFLLATLSMGTLTVLGIADVFPARELNHSVYGTLPAFALMAVALFRLRLFDVQPVARNTIVENLRDPILVLDRDHRIVDFNRASRRLWPAVTGHVGSPLEELDSTLADEIRPLETDDGDRSTEASDGTIDSGPAASPQFVRTVGGERRHYSVTVSAVDRYEGVGWYAIVLRDVTALERSRQQLRAQNERLDQVAATISHDLRNPIQVADGYVDLLADEFAAPTETESEAETDATAAPDVETARSYLNATDRAIDRMDAIVQDVLTLTREGKPVEETEELRLGAVAREAWQHVETGSATLTVADDRRLRADRGRLLSILENCFRNAVEHGSTSPPSGAQQDAVEHGSTSPASQAQQDAVAHGSTSSRPQADDAVEHGSGEGDPDASVTVTVGATESGFYVADDGPGIPDDVADDVFEYGYTTATDGTGFGLSIVRTMAESHGWTVELDRDYAAGARFVFEITGGERSSPEGASLPEPELEPEPQS